MAGIFDMKDGKFIVDPNAIIIPPFKDIWERDKSKTKETAINELCFVYFAADFNSPYITFPEDEKIERIKQDFLVKNKLKPDSLLLHSIEVYKQFQETHSMRLLNSARVAADKMSTYFNNINFDDEDDSGKLKYVAKDVASTLANVGKIVESLDKLEEKVKKEIKTTTKVRGGGAASKWER